MITALHTLTGQPVIVGGGIAGLMTALELAPQPVVLISKARLGTEASTPWAQGGLAAALGADDSAGLHLADTMRAGDGLCDEDVAKQFADAAPQAIRLLQRYGVCFDMQTGGGLALGLEAAHSRNRIVHAHGDGTGREIIRALITAVQNCPSITVIEGMEVRHLFTDGGGVTGALATNAAGSSIILASRRVILATGGIGGLFFDTTNPPGCFGQGIALAAQAGAELADLEFIQFHPTAFDTGVRPMPLISEAVRGEGAILVDETGRRFLADEPGAELAPRDMVTRGIWRHLSKGHHVFLDARNHPGSRFETRFPAITAICREAGLNPATQPIPVRPAAHYHMGGVAVNLAGQSSVPGLWACGEVASTGLHGANRLASNSLTEAVICAAQIAQSVSETQPSGARMPSAIDIPPPPDSQMVRPLMSRGLGVIRDAAEIRRSARELYRLAMTHGPASAPASVGLMIAIAALERRESRGGHFRADFPQRDPVARRSVLRLDQALVKAANLENDMSLAGTV